MGELSKQESMTRALATMEFHPAILEDETKAVEYTKIPLSRVSDLGVGIQPLVQAIKQFSGNGSGLYEVVVPRGAHLASFKNGSGNLGTVLSDTTNMITGQAKLNPVALNPTMVFMAAALANIDKKLDAIQEAQKEMMDFLKQKEKSEMRGNLNFLADIMENFKHNWDNALYKNSHHVKVLDIKQSAEQKIDFYRNQIQDKVNKRNLLHMDQDVKKQVEGVQDYFKDYQLALYMFAYSSFLEVMLLENYGEAYLSGISKKIENYSNQYHALFSQCFAQIADYSKSSVQSVLLKGLSKASKASGRLIEKVPLVSKSQLDENLIEAGDKLTEFNIQHNQKMVLNLADKEQEYVMPFKESIDMVNKLYNNDLRLAFDGKAMYIGAAN